MKYEIVSKTTNIEYIDSIEIYRLRVLLIDEFGNFFGGNIYDKSIHVLESSYDVGTCVDAEIKDTRGGNTVNVMLINACGENTSDNNIVIYQF